MSAYNEIEKVVEKDRLPRHLPDGHTGQGWQEVPLWRVRL